MLLRFSLSAAGALMLASGATAQNLDQALPTFNVKDAGTYHLATDTWTHTGGASGWNDVLFDNTCSTGYYGPRLVTHRIVDDGRIPSTSSPENHGPPIANISWTGTLDAYTVNFFEFAYCTFDPTPTMEINFWYCFSGCQDISAVAPDVGFNLVNMPGVSGTASGACWTVGIDLANFGTPFTMIADCDGVWSGGGTNDTFGWSWQQTTPSTGGTPGPWIAGDPLGYLSGGPGSNGCAYGANTVFYNGALPNSQGTGLDGMDQWERHEWVAPNWNYNGCWWYGGYFNGNLFGSFHMKVQGDAQANIPVGTQYCPGDGIPPHTPCPYINNNNGGPGGCSWGDPAFPGGGVLDATGSNVWGNSDTFLHATDVQNNFGIFFGGNNATNGGNGAPLNDGLRCAGGGVVRLTSPTNTVGNQQSTPAAIQTLDSGGGSGVTRRYQFWFRSPGGPGGTFANLTNGYEIVWL